MPTPIKISFAQIRNQPVRIQGQSLEVGQTGFRFDDRLSLDASLGAVSIQAIRHAAENLFRLTRDDCPVQLSILAFTATARHRALDFYFPITQMLTGPEIVRFYDLTEHIARHPHFDLRLLGEDRRDLTSQMPPAIRRIAAGQLAEVFFQRTELLEGFLAGPRHIRLYTSQRAFEQDGGISGGDYNAGRQSIQLVLKRLLEGFFGETAGVCPFLHELGHMLDHFDLATGRMGRAEGLLPGLSQRDGAFFNPRARSLFLRGKRLELKRYLARRQGLSETAVPFPIGHPYVFQNDGEFIAGYFEMFFRNPNYFAGQNQDLYDAFVAIFGYDPRNAWKQDFPLYIEQNRGFYLSGQLPRAPGLTVPGE
jgi:hypothetical protein